jgi:hypothetical protein
MNSYEAHLKRMSDPAYAAAVRAVVAKAPPLTEEQKARLRVAFFGPAPLLPVARAKKRKTA